MFSWQKHIEKNLGKPVTFRKNWPFMLKAPTGYQSVVEVNDPKVLLFFWRGECERNELWYHKNRYKSRWYLGREFSTDHATFSFIYCGKSEIRAATVMSMSSKSKYLRLGGLDDGYEIRTLMEAIGNPDLMPLCISYNWTKGMVQAALEDL